MVEVQGMKVDGVEITIGFLVGLALGYYVTKHWLVTGKAA